MTSDSWNLRFFGAAALAASISWSPPAASAPESPSPQTVLVLFDSSGSMWGNLAGRRSPKFEIAREALRNSFSADASAQVKTGMIVFGRSCVAANLTSAPALQSADDLVVSLERLNPKGKGPITLALARAAEVLDPQDNATLILIHDGPDNCRTDPCAQAGELAQTHPNLKAHLVSIGMNEQALGATSCIAEQLGGRVFEANDAAGLDDAVDAAVNLAMLSAGPEQKTPGAPAEAAPDADTPLAANDGPPQLVLSATLGPSGPAIREPVRWQIYKSGAGADEAPLLDVSEPRFAVPLEPGAYRVKAGYGFVSAEREFTVNEKGATQGIVGFEAGRISIEAAANSASETLISVALATDGATPGQTSAAKPIVLSTSKRGSIVLPSGTYWVTSQRGAAQERTKMTVDEGRELSLVPLAQYGELAVEIAASQGNARETYGQQDVVVTVAVDDPDHPTGRRVLRRSAGGSARFTLPAGTYYVKAQSGLASREAQVALSPGRTVSRNLDLSLATLSLRTNVEASGTRDGLDVLYRISRLGGSQTKEVAWSGSSEPEFRLPPGRYQITAEVGARNVRASQTVNLTAGQKADIALSARAARVSLELADIPSGQYADRFWEVRTAGGDVVWRTNRYAPTAVLAPGRYLVRCETRAGVLEGAFTVESGEDRRVALSAN